MCTIVVVFFQKVDNCNSFFFSCNTKTHDRFKTSTKLIYDFCKNCENKRQQDEALPELIVKHFDDEQIWQELELQNNSVVDKLLGNVVGLVTKINSVNFLAEGIEKQSKSRNKKTQKKDLINDPNNEEEEEESDETDQEIDKIKLRLEDSDDDIGDMKNDDDDDDDDDDMDFDFDSINPIQYKNNDTSDDDDGKENVDEIDSDAGKKKKNKKKRVKGSIVDDKFFKLAEMEAFLEQEDAKEMKKQRQEEKGDDESDEEDIDLFTNFSPEDEEVKSILVSS
jgi:U3 small nucleolar RNA-associated protein MPP10